MSNMSQVIISHIPLKLKNWMRVKDPFLQIQSLCIKLIYSYRGQTFDKLDIQWLSYISNNCIK